ncbi:hypothetical protein M0R45_037797 [Rubus argutus]|uniref:Expansin-like CBD domain-containing protein n=1 Tax=Rubus argutus TaxID=59490 RepID=A0AAW1W3C8_RUBAR
MALPGQAEKLRDAGVLQILFARVACDYSGKTIAFPRGPRLKPELFCYCDRNLRGVGNLMQGVRIAPLPLSIRLTSQYSGQTLLAKNVIPNGWKPGATYKSLVNYL